MARPTSIVAGDTYEWVVSSSDYPASDGYSLKVTIVNDQGKISATTATATNGEDWDVTLTAAQSMQLTSPGFYHILEVAESGSGASIVRHTLFAGSVEVKHHLADVLVATDARSTARKMLDAIEAKAYTILENGYVSLNIGDRSITYPSFTELLRVRARLVEEVKRDEDAYAISQGLEPNKPIRTRFSGIL